MEMVSGIYRSLLTTPGDLKQARPVTQMYDRKASIVYKHASTTYSKTRDNARLKRQSIQNIYDLNKLNPSDI